MLLIKLTAVYTNHFHLQAAERGQEEAIKYLLSWKPEVTEVKDIRGRSPMDCLPKDKQHLSKHFPQEAS